MKVLKYFIAIIFLLALMSTKFQSNYWLKVLIISCLSTLIVIRAYMDFFHTKNKKNST